MEAWSKMNERTERPVVGLYVDKSCSEHWIVKDRHGQFWTVPPGDNAWERRQRFHPSEETELAPVPGHYLSMLGLPG
jgi:hypothetical protein